MFRWNHLIFQLRWLTNLSVETVEVNILQHIGDGYVFLLILGLYLIDVKRVIVGQIECLHNNSLPPIVVNVSLEQLKKCPQFDDLFAFDNFSTSKSSSMSSNSCNLGVALSRCFDLTLRNAFELMSLLLIMNLPSFSSSFLTSSWLHPF